MSLIKHNVADFPKGWFVGDFSPVLVKNKDVEVSIKYYKAGDKEQTHCHKIATEYTAVVQGTVTFNDVQYNAGEIVEVPAGEYAEFAAITDAITVVVKTPSVPGDKYIAFSTNEIISADKL